MDTANITHNPENLNKPVRQPTSRSKVIFIILGVVILTELIIVVIWLANQNQPKPVSPTADVAMSGASLALSTQSSEVVVGSTFDVDVRIDTAGKSVDGADLILKYDPSLIEATSSGFVRGVFAEYPLIQTSNNGQFSASGISGFDNSYSGAGLFATVRFLAKKPGMAEIVFDFTPGQTVDSNITQSITSEDILSLTNSLKVNILP